MDNILSILQNRKLENIPPPPKYNWQEGALEAINILADGFKNKASIFRCFKLNSQAAKITLLDCKELEKPYSMYFFKIFYELNKNKKM